MKEMKQEGCEDGSSRGTNKEADLQDFLFFESCRPSAVDFVEEISPESPREMQDQQEVTSETSWNATRGKDVDEWRLEKVGDGSGNISAFFVRLSLNSHQVLQ